jgi:hypothetical protein
MDYFFIDTLGNAADTSLCLLDSAPEDIGLKYYKMARGDRIGADFPTDAEIYMSDDFPGIKLSSLLGNTKSYLICSTALKDLLLGHCPQCDIECLPFTLYNHKRRKASDDYWIVNPIGVVDVTDPRESVIEFFQGKVVSVTRYVLDPAKLVGAPPLFRPRELPNEYVINSDLADAIQKAGMTNVILNPIEVAQRTP